MLTQTRPFPPPAIGGAFARGFVGFAELVTGAGVLLTVGVLGVFACFLPNQSEFDGVGLGATAGVDGVGVAADIAFLWLSFFVGCNAVAGPVESP